MYWCSLRVVVYQQQSCRSDLSTLSTRYKSATLVLPEDIFTPPLLLYGFLIQYSPINNPSEPMPRQSVNPYTVATYFPCLRVLFLITSSANHPSLSLLGWRFLLINKLPSRACISVSQPLVFNLDPDGLVFS